MKTTLVAIALATSLSLPAFGQTQVSPEKEQAIRKLMELTGAMELGSQLYTNLFAQLRPAFPQVPDSLWDELAASFDPAEATELVIPIYDRHFSLTELRALIEFYTTPVGQQVIKKLPLVAQESMVVGQQWGQAKAQAIIERLSQRGYEPVAM